MKRTFPGASRRPLAAAALEQSRLRPWIFLVVLKEGEFVERKGSGPLPAFEFVEGLDPAAFFPHPDQTWAWAHVAREPERHRQRAADRDRRRRGWPSNRTSRRPSAPTPTSRRPGSCARGSSRTTRRITPSWSRRSRRAGSPDSGSDIPPGTSGQRSSWDAGQRVYPIYYRWFFRTGEKGDFEFLVDLLEPRPVDKRVGVRSMDMQEPGYEVEGMSGALRVMGLEGALKSTEMEPSPSGVAPCRDGLRQSARGLRRDGS